MKYILAVAMLCCLITLPCCIIAASLGLSPYIAATLGVSAVYGGFTAASAL